MFACVLFLLLPRVAAFERTPPAFAGTNLLFARDACSNAFGANASDAVCSPSNTLCCIRNDQVFPQCDTYLNKGWCCVGSDPTDNCYVDQPSDCSVQNSVPCVNLGPGTTQACCPPLTSCDLSINATLGAVRCNIRRSDLIAAAGTSSTTASTAAASSSAIQTSTLLSSTTSSTSSSTQSTAESVTLSSQFALSLGAIAGIAIGVVVVLVAAVAVFYLFWRERRKHRAGGGDTPALSGAQNTYDAGQGDFRNEYKNVGYGPAEVMGSTERYPVELDGTQYYLPTSR